MTLNLKEVRKKHNLTQEEMGKELGITRQQVILIEKGKPMNKRIQILFDNYNKRSNAIAGMVSESNRTETAIPGYEEEEYTNMNSEAISIVASSNKILAESQKISAESYKILAESQKTLVDNESKLIDILKVNSSNNPKSPQDVESIIPLLLELVPLVVSGKYKSVGAVEAALRRKLFEGHKISTHKSVGR